jgi:signal transduction histidine kinase
VAVVAAAILLLTLALFYGLMRPSVQDFLVLAAILAVTAALTVGATYAAYRWGWITRAPRLIWILVGGYAGASVVSLFSVWITAMLMFASQHDLLLASVLLVFAGGIAVAIAYVVSCSIEDRLVRLGDAAQRVAQGELSTRVEIQGRDEIAELARSFNEMSAQLEAAAEKQRELEQLRRDLVAWISHDLRTPLASIRVILEALGDGVVDDPEAVDRYLRTAQHHIRSLSSLLDDLFDVAQIEAGGLKIEPRPSSIGDLISDTLESFSAVAAQKGVTLQGSVAPGTDPVEMDVQKVGRVLYNLLDNALRHTPRGGMIEVLATAADDHVRVEVCDDGEGIRGEDLPRVFERFYRGEKSRSRATGGAGLGLAIVKGIVEAHGGDVGIDSQPGKGTRVWFILPQ